MKAVVANLDNDWTLTATDIDTFLRSTKRRSGVELSMATKRQSACACC